MEDGRCKNSAIRHQTSAIRHRKKADSRQREPAASLFSYDPQNLMAKELFSSKYLFVWKKLITFAA
jgi:hypothetical protein